MQGQVVITVMSKEDIDTIAGFQIDMAKETENMDLSRQIITKGLHHIVEYPEQSFYLIAKINNEPTGSIMSTEENSKISWIQSVYVSKSHRQKGIFKKLFNNLCQIQKQKGIQRILLYVQTNNEKAFQTYIKLGMSLNQINIFGYEFVYSNDTLPPVQQQYTIKDVSLPQNHQLQDILLIKDRNNKYFSLMNGQQLVGYVEYFKQFSDWRYGESIYVSKLLLKNRSVSVLAFLLKYLKQNTTSQLEISTIRFLASKISCLSDLIPIPLLHYNVLEISL